MSDVTSVQRRSGPSGCMQNWIKNKSHEKKADETRQSYLFWNKDAHLWWWRMRAAFLCVFHYVKEYIQTSICATTVSIFLTLS